MIAFASYELIKSDKGFVLLHNRLAGNDANYGSHGILTIAFRAMVALKMAFHDHKWISYAETIYPGLALFAALPGDIDFFPKFTGLANLINEVVRLTGEELVGQTVRTKLKVNDRGPLQDSQILNFYAIMTGGDIEQAMPLCYEVTDEVVKSYYEVAAPYGIRAENLQGLKDYIREKALHDIGHGMRPSL